MSDKIRAPWTREQVAALNEFQRRGGMHPLTCGFRGSVHALREGVLIAGPDGWHCPIPGCLYTQDWAHAFMADPGPAATEATQTTARVFAGLHHSAEQDVTRVINLYERWVKAGPPPLGVSLSRWWDRRLVELHQAILPAAEQPERTTVNNPATSAWAPPPPGDTREQLPDEILTHIRRNLTDYTSTACGLARALVETMADNPDTVAELKPWRERMHARCRLNHKFTGQQCSCWCHETEEQPGA